MSQNPDPFSLQFDPMTPKGPVTSQLEETPPPLPPRPHLRRRPVPPPGAAGSQSAASPPQCPQFGELGGYPSSSLSSSPRYNFLPPDDPSSSLRSPPTYSFSPHDAGYSPVPSAMPAPSSPSIQPSQVIVNGVALGQADLLTLQAVVGLVLPGYYWYDSISGAYGTVGGPCTGFLPAAPALGGGPLAPDASGHTGTGVFINGREIHSMDVAGLQRMGAVVMRGRWWLRADGSYGAEGSFVVLGNLRMQAANAASNAGGGAHTWSTSQGHYGGSDGQGFMYVGGPGWSWTN